MAFPEEFLYELRLRNPMEEVASGYVNLKRAGHNYKALCPFHGEKTPSFTVYPDSSSFFCFGCGAGGDVITFIKKIENLDYPEAVRFLAGRVGMTVPEDAAMSGLADAKLRIREINREAANFYYQTLCSASGIKAREYAAARGLGGDVIKRFGIGFAPDSWDALYRHLSAKGFKDEDMEAADLVRKNRFSKMNDRYRNRLMFPIVDLQGSVIGFGGRDLSGTSNAKYINTSDTLVYKKTRNLYALNIAKNSGQRSLLLCEGYMDVIAMHCAGYPNAVASCGTALTEEQVQLISRYADRVVLAYDADEAGQKAVRRAIPMLKKTDLDIRVLVVENAKDPDEYIKKNGPGAFMQLLEKAPSDTEYLINCERRLFNMDSPDGRVKFLNAAVAVISKINNKIERDVYAGKLAQETGADKQSILDQMASDSRRSQKKQDRESFVRMTQEASGRNDKINKERAANLRAASAEDKLICYLFKNPDRHTWLSELLPPEKMVTDFNRRVYSHILNCAATGRTVDVGCLADSFTPEETGAVTALTVSMADVNFSEADVRQCARIITNASDELPAEKIGQYQPEEIQKFLAELAKKKKNNKGQ